MEVKKVVLCPIGPSSVATVSVKLTRRFPESLSLLPSRCLITKVEAYILSYRASKADDVSFTSSIKETLSMPWAPPELPCV